MKTVCAWCNKTKTGASHFEGLVSHGICKECAAWIKKSDNSMEFMEYLNTLHIPVVVVNTEGKIADANTPAQKRFKKDSTVLHGMSGGDFMSCSNARLPGGCGNTIHCRSCTIRNTVMSTFEDGEAREKIPAYLDTTIQNEPKKVGFLISTVRVNNAVWLRVEDVT